MASTVLPISIASPATPVPAVRRNFALRLRRASQVCCLSSSSAPAPSSASPTSTSTRSQSHGESITKIAADPSGNVVVRLAPASESTIERVSNSSQLTRSSFPALLLLVYLLKIFGPRK
ncbi:hypothetical protein BHE74_00022953 [Ensete ventricosum]|nr:hypothetical protein GW17_00002945 [Ensete ventricosum]RWW69450.1 hypothetical protein BHE74_00022953 [Ensete ventricosum]RZR92796.1 hypothetical protein BHM03_00021152 [Ensete ventricosum]